MSSLSNDKVEVYQRFLQKPYLELRELAYLCSGLIPDGMFFNFSCETAEKFGVKQFGIPKEVFNLIFQDCFQDQMVSSIDRILNALLSAIDRGAIRAEAVRLDGMEYSFDALSKKYPYLMKHTYILSPEAAIAAVVVKGVLLPIELQKAYGINQIPESMARLTKWVSDCASRYALAQKLRWDVSKKDELPKEKRNNISYLCRLADELKRTDRGRKHKRFEFWPTSDYTYDKSGTGKRPREPFQKVKAVDNEGISFIPGIVEKRNGALFINFQLFRIVLDRVSCLILLDEENITSHELLQHPLIRVYGEIGGASVQKIVSFCLKKRLLDLDLSNREWEG